MKAIQDNPFNITKAVDFSDQEIANYWIDFGENKNSFLQLAKPTSPMTMHIMGGKGSGKTHLMRYLSYDLQKIRKKDDIVNGLKSEKYIGLYFRCAGLNASRFSGKGVSDETWRDLFAYYMELWFAKLVLETIDDAFAGHQIYSQKEAEICHAILNLFDIEISETIATISDLTIYLNSLQKKVNFTVNNSAITRDVSSIEILVTPGTLTFGIPKILASQLPELSSIRFLYLIDEFENIGIEQQKHINTLYREREDPCSFKIGGRLYGFRTSSTFGADEDNREGSEYEILNLDSCFRKTPNDYLEFARKMCHQRLKEAGFSINKIDEYFDVFEDSKFATELVRHITANRDSQNKPYFDILESRLKYFLKFNSNTEFGIKSTKEIKKILSNLEVADYPFVEKINTFLLYRDWSDKKNLIESSIDIGEEATRFIQGENDTRHSDVLKHYRLDLLAQLVHNYKNKQLYLGFETFVYMSDGLPRNLLTILKNVFKWSQFNGEEPFISEKISKDSQRIGVREASEWFYQDARIASHECESARLGVEKIATFLRDVRYSDKPSDCSPLAFSVNLSLIPESTVKSLELAEQLSLLIEIEGGHRDKNSKRVDAKYQINSMLSPRWDLPVGRRGTIAFSKKELISIFDLSSPIDFEALSSIRIKRMMAPEFQSKNNSGIATLPGIDNE